MRIRSIKPEFWRSDDIDALCIEDRLLFIGLWSYVDDSGVGVDKPSAIAADLFAGDLSRDPQECSVRVHGGLKRLSEAGLIYRYSADGRRYLHITSWDRHQRINRPTESRFPGPTSGNAESSDSCSEGSVRAQADYPVGTGEQGNRGEEEKSSSAARTETDPDPADAKPTDRFPEFYAAYPRRVQRRDAEKAWRAAMRRKADAGHVIAAAKRYAELTRTTDPRFVKHPASWLNSGAYDDQEPSLTADADLNPWAGVRYTS